MRKKDKLIQEAFKAYQSGQSDKPDDMDKLYSEGFEEKIFNRIEKMHIKNPRIKARIIYVVSILLCVICLTGGILYYYQSQESMRTTQRVEKMWKEACASGGVGGVKTRYLCKKEEKSGKWLGGYVYKTVTLTREQSKLFEGYNIDCKKQDISLVGSAADMGSFCGTGTASDSREVYQLSDRGSRLYLILKEKDNKTVSLAKYVGADSGTELQEAVTSKDIIQDIFGIKSADDIRSVTIERYQERSKNDTEKMVAMYTNSKEKKAFLSVFGKENQVAIFKKGIAKKDVMQFVAGTEGKTWEEVSKKFPKKCYLLAIENEMEENWVMGILIEKDNVQIYVDTSADDEQVRCLVLEDEEQKWLSETIKEVDKVY